MEYCKRYAALMIAGDLIPLMRYGSLLTLDHLFQLPEVHMQARSCLEILLLYSEGLIALGI